MVPGFFILIVLMLGLMLLFRLFAGSLDRERVQDHIRGEGGELLACSWEPFGPGWFGEKSDRIYQVLYRDARGRIRRAHVKTSMLSGVYLTNDRVLGDAEARTALGQTANVRRAVAVAAVQTPAAVSAAATGVTANRASVPPEGRQRDNGAALADNAVPPPDNGMPLAGCEVSLAEDGGLGLGVAALREENAQLRQRVRELEAVLKRRT